MARLQRGAGPDTVAKRRVCERQAGGVVGRVPGFAFAFAFADDERGFAAVAQRRVLLRARLHDRAHAAAGEVCGGVGPAGVSVKQPREAMLGS